MKSHKENLLEFFDRKMIPCKLIGHYQHSDEVCKSNIILRSLFGHQYILDVPYFLVKSDLIMEILAIFGNEIEIAEFRYGNFTSTLRILIYTKRNETKFIL